MFSHVMIGANDIGAAKVFYDAILSTLGHAPGEIDEHGRCFYRTSGGVFGLSLPLNGEPACNGNGSTLGFLAASSEAADAWHAAGLANGGVTCEDPPGVRGGPSGMYLAYLRDPSGNKICALHSLS